MKICILQSSFEGSLLDEDYQTPPRDFSNWIKDAEFHHEFLVRDTISYQIEKLSQKDFDIFVNLCEMYPDPDFPAKDVIYALEHFNLPYTGPNPRLYDPSKDIMKQFAISAGVKVPNFAVINTEEDIKEACKLSFPLFVKPNDSGDSIGIDEKSLVIDEVSLHKKVLSVLDEVGQTIIEEYIDGREFTVLVIAEAEQGKSPLVLKPIEYIFPEKENFKTHSLKMYEYYPDSNVPCEDIEITSKLKDAASRIFISFSGVGYARMDFRLSKNNELYFLESNFDCTVLYSGTHYGSADYILKYDLGQVEFLKKIIDEGIMRHRKRQKPIHSSLELNIYYEPFLRK